MGELNQDGGTAPASVVIIGRGFEARGRLRLVARQRVSDHINEPRTMLIIEGAVITGAGRFAPDADELAINRSEILLVVPVHEPHRRDPAAADLAMKEQHRVRLLTGSWVVEGSIHVTPEVSVERFINMGHGEFLPLTETALIGPDSERTQGLVLVSRSHITLLRRVRAVDPEADQHSDPAW